MSQGFRLRFDEMQEGAGPARTENLNGGKAADEVYETPGHARALVLIWPDGRRLFLSYMYLVAGEMLLEAQYNVITLQFSNHHVTLKGFRLEALFTALLDHLPRTISVSDERYFDGTDFKTPYVTEISVKDKA